MKNLTLFLAALLMLASCDQSVSLTENELSDFNSDPQKNIPQKLPQKEAISIGVMPTDRELYEFSKKMTGEKIEELEQVFLEYYKETGEQFPLNMQLSVITDPSGFIMKPKPVPCICRPRLIPDEFIGKLHIKDIVFSVFGSEPSLINIELVNEKGNVLFTSEVIKEQKRDLKYTASLKLVQIQEIEGKEFFINVNTNYLVKDRPIKKSLEYSFSEKML